MKNIEDLIKIKNKTTGIGSVPHSDAERISDIILKNCPELPYWPQLVNCAPGEEMLLQYTENLPCIKADLEKEAALYDDSALRDEELLKFYENLTSGNIDYFKISKEFASGFYLLLDKLKNSDVGFIKGQVVGPVTFLTSVKGADGKSLLYDDNLSDAIVRGLAMKGVWQAKQIIRQGKTPVIFFDEPAMAGFGSAFMSLNSEEAMAIFDKLIDTVREHEDFPVGMHICGNSDWELILQTRIDILNFDAFAYAENFVIYSDHIKRFLERGGVIAWGVVPTLDYNESVNLDMIFEKFNNAVAILQSKGLNRDYIVERSIFTPACGVGTLTQDDAEKIIDLTYQFAEQISA